MQKMFHNYSLAMMTCRINLKAGKVPRKIIVILGTPRSMVYQLEETTKMSEATANIGFKSMAKLATKLNW